MLLDRRPIRIFSFQTVLVFYYFLKSNTSVRWFITFLTLATVVSFAQAEVIHIDLGDSTSGPGGNWNTIANADQNSTVPGLIDFNTGSPTPVTYTGTGWTGSETSGGAFTGNLDWVHVQAGVDYLLSSSTASITFFGLGADPWSVDLVSARTSNEEIDITAQGLFSDGSFKHGAGENSDNWNIQSDGFDDFLIWNSVTPSSGSITLNFTRLGGQGPAANAIRLQGTIIPEPGTTVLILALAAGAIAGHQRSRRRSDRND